MFQDPDGLLGLSNKQQKSFQKWVHCGEFFGLDTKTTKPQYLAHQINGYEVMQNSVGDCSVVSSLAVAFTLRI